MADSRPIFLSTYIKAFLISLNNNFGTLTTYLLWAVSLLTYTEILLMYKLSKDLLPKQFNIWTIHLDNRLYYIFKMYIFWLHLFNIEAKVILYKFI